VGTNLRLLILIVAYKAEGTLRNVIKRIPVGLSTSFDTQILIIDDSSNDSTYALAKEASIEYAENLSIEVLRNPQTLGYGGNQQVGFQYAIQKHFDLIALVHGDGQYASESSPELL
jgi:glycosyltransferase involved in cell wall biosynthesis